MRRLVALLCALLAVVFAPVASAATPTWPSSLHAGGHLSLGERLVSPNGRYHAAVERDGRLVVRNAAGRQIWATPRTGADAVLHVTSAGQLALRVGGQARWRSRTAGSGASDVLTMGDDGVLVLHAARLQVWSARAPNRCPATSGKAFVVDLSAQRARLCRRGQQLRTSLVTTGASDLGYGTPTGTWRFYARVRNTTLYPAAGGAYPVKFWMPYDGPYGAHDSPWQRFPYGSSAYKTRGSHGCIHVPGRMMAWLFDWARVGTRVTVHR
jgi:hypothetical protein